MIRQFFITLCVIGFLGGMVTSPTPAHAQKTEFMNWSFSADENVKSLINKALSNEIEEYKKEFQNTMPMIQISLNDVNGDNKPEIFARFVEEYYFRDKNDNVNTYGFAYTKKGLIKIFDTMAGDVVLGTKDKSGLREIIAFKGMTTQHDIFSWDGKRRYIKK